MTNIEYDNRYSENPDEVTAWLSWWCVARVDVDLITRR